MAAGQRLVSAPATGGTGPPYADDAPRRCVCRHFWSVAVPFSLVLAAQVGFLVHFVAFLMPRLGPAGTATAVSIAAGAAMLGRIALGLVIDRLDQRRVSAVSFASQAVALGLMLALPDRPEALYGGGLAVRPLGRQRHHAAVAHRASGVRRRGPSASSSA